MVLHSHGPSGPRKLRYTDLSKNNFQQEVEMFPTFNGDKFSHNPKPCSRTPLHDTALLRTDFLDRHIDVL